MLEIALSNSETNGSGSYIARIVRGLSVGTIFTTGLPGYALARRSQRDFYRQRSNRRSKRPASANSTSTNPMITTISAIVRRALYVLCANCSR